MSEAQAKLQRLQEKDVEIEDQKREITAAIAQAKRVIHIQTESTSSEVFRLKSKCRITFKYLFLIGTFVDELETLEDFHLWRCTKMSPRLMKFIYAARFEVSIPCDNFICYKPSASQLTVTKTNESKLKERDPFPALTDLMVSNAPFLLQTRQDGIQLPAVVQRLGDFWTSCAQIRSQLTFLRVKYPLVVDTISANKGPPSLRAKAAVIFPSVKSKVHITFIFDWDTYSRWPLSISSLRCEVKVAYGGIE